MPLGHNRHDCAVGNGSRGATKGEGGGQQEPAEAGEGGSTDGHDEGGGLCTLGEGGRVGGGVMQGVVQRRGAR
jgi:hypothetical protein